MAEKIKTDVDRQLLISKIKKKFNFNKMYESSGFCSNSSVNKSKYYIDQNS